MASKEWEIIVFAPKYWLGWKSEVDYHKNIIAEFMEGLKYERIL